MKAEIRLITPEWAQHVLDNMNAGNRAMNRLHVEALAREMEEGRWKLNGDTICINAERLIDGQHRLQAVVQSGVPIQSFVIEGLPSDVFDTKDVGKRRSAGDTLGVLGEKNAYRLAAALIIVDKYFNGWSDKSVLYTNTEVEGLLAKYPGVRQHVLSSYKAKGIMPPTLLDALHYLFSRKDPALAEEFVQQVVLGLGVKEGTAWQLLRNRLLRNSASRAKLPKHYIMAICIKAWNYTRAGHKPRYMHWREGGDASEAFPLIR